MGSELAGLPKHKVLLAAAGRDAVDGAPDRR